MKNKKYIFFDLDGTLTDPGLGITRSVQYALAHYGIKIDDLKALKCFIGPPLQDSFRDFYGFDREKAFEAVEKYREYYSQTGIFENELYSGIPELLTALCGLDKTLVVATSKPTVFAERVLDHFGIRQYFDLVIGSELNGERTDKSEVIDFAIKHLSISDVPCIVMIGDRKHDIIGAKKCGIDSIGVLFGYGDMAELESAGANLIAATVSELHQLLV